MSHAGSGRHSDDIQFVQFKRTSVNTNQSIKDFRMDLDQEIPMSEREGGSWHIKGSADTGVSIDVSGGMEVF